MTTPLVSSNLLILNKKALIDDKCYNKFLVILKLFLSALSENVSVVNELFDVIRSIFSNYDNYHPLLLVDSDVTDKNCQ